MKLHEGWLIAREPSRLALPGERWLADNIVVSADQSRLTEALSGGGPNEFLFFLGCASWSPGQLARELKEGAWVVSDFDSEILFDTPADKIWDTALARFTGVSNPLTAVREWARA